MDAEESTPILVNLPRVPTMGLNLLSPSVHMQQLKTTALIFKKFDTSKFYYNFSFHYNSGYNQTNIRQTYKLKHMNFEHNVMFIITRIYCGETF
jgi:hypothetical protein